MASRRILNPERVCPECGEVLTLTEAEARRRRRAYCSQRCAAADRDRHDDGRFSHREAAR